MARSAELRAVQARYAEMTGRYRCTKCGEECALTIEDLGIGDYEYWGSKGKDVDLQIVSDCCETSFKEIEDDEEEEEDGTPEA